MTPAFLAFAALVVWVSFAVAAITTLRPAGAPAAIDAE
jgi:hypothetical protein